MVEAARSPVPLRRVAPLRATVRIRPYEPSGSGGVLGLSPYVSFHLLDPLVASEHEIDGEEVLGIWTRIGSAKHLGAAGGRDHHASLVAGDLHGRGGLARKAGPDHPCVDPVRSGDHHRPSTGASR
jgi:hypothetical protein